MPSFTSIGASAPGAVDTALVTTPSRTYYVGQLAVCNQATSPTTFRVALDADGATGSLSVAEAIFYDAPIGPNETVLIRKLCLQPASKVWVRGGTANVVFNMHGLQYVDTRIMDLPQILGAANTSAGSDVQVFSATSTNSSGTGFKVFVCNTGAVPRTFRLHLDSNGNGIIVATETIAYDMPIGPNETIEFEGLGLVGGGRLYYQASSTDVTVVATGSVIMAVA